MSNEPLLVVGILPGATKGQVESYARTNNISIPMYVDADRSFEKKLIAAGLLPKPISLSNVIQSYIADGTGSLKPAWGDLKEAVKRVSPTTKWKVDPKEVADGVKPAWRAMEFGQMAEAGPQIAQALKSNDAATKAGAEVLVKAIKAHIEALMTEAKAKSEAGEKWTAYKIYMAISADFKDFAESKPAATEMSRLKSDKVVAKELQAHMALENILKNFVNSPVRSKQVQGKQYLEQLPKQFPDTEAAAQAKALL